MKRRSFVAASSAAFVTSLMRARASFASAPTENRLVFLFLRGGLDGLHALPPHADPAYHALRPRLGFGAPNSDLTAHDLDGYFGLNPALSALLPLYHRGELLFLPAAATSYRDRSHFDGQNMLENGSGKPYGAQDGWLNRAILALNEGDRRLGLALGPSVPLILQGEARIQTWADSRLPRLDEDFMMRIGRIYQHDRLFAEALHEATGVLKPEIDASMIDAGGQTKDFLVSAQAAGDLLARADGPRIAVIELQGWDTHFAQNRRLTSLLGAVADGIETLRARLKQKWANTAIVVVSEFGRTAAENSSYGTDHGTGGIAMLAGGAINGGRIAGQWPGLAAHQLYEGRDLRALNPYEGLFKALLIGHLGLPAGVIEDHIFPASRSAAPMDGLLRSA